MRKLARDAALYLVLALLLGSAANLLPKRQLAWWGKGHEPPLAGLDYDLIDPGSADLERSSLAGVVVLDTRSAAEFAAGHVPGAAPISYTDLDRQWTAALESRLKRASAVLIYGASDETDVEQLLAQELRHRGVPRPQVLAGGFGAWLQAGLPVEGGAG
ncbi:MAG TPA: rhodanese-like domain-containing protein [Thermoanaerobaculaceae bacterium]|nr:rhodanese-like domain-containing protein [Thermoanaerobaculaceae bacterium]